MEDTVVATLEFANGAIGALEAATTVYPGYRRRVELTGSEGTIILEQDRIVAADLRTPLADRFEPMEETANSAATSSIVTEVSGHKRIIEDFLRAIETNTRPICDGREGRRSVEVVEAIYESSRTGKPVIIAGRGSGV